MKKVMVLCGLCLLVPVCAFAQTLDQTLDNCAAYLKNQLPRGSRAAVLNIEARSAEFSDYITDGLSARLVRQNHLTIVERGSVLHLLETEQNYQMSGNVSDETATSIGKQLGTELIITGSMMPRGDSYTMNIRVVHVETARIQTQWSANNISMDSSVVQMNMPVIAASVRFAGTALDIMDQDTLIQDLQRALDTHHITIEIVPPDDDPSNTEYSFIITLRVNSRAATLTADLSLAFRRGNRTLKQSARHTYSELDMEYVIRKSGEVLVNDKEFFQSLPGIIAKQ